MFNWLHGLFAFVLAFFKREPMNMPLTVNCHAEAEARVARSRAALLKAGISQEQLNRMLYVRAEQVRRYREEGDSRQEEYAREDWWELRDRAAEIGYSTPRRPEECI